jgi:hypothetical protein
VTNFDASSPPPTSGSFEDARLLAEWDFLRKTPEQRLQWLVGMLDIGYASGAFKTVRRQQTWKVSEP